MMNLKKILVANDTLNGMSAALSKAAVLEHYTGATVEIAEVIWDAVERESLPEQDKANLIEAYVSAERQGLRNLMAPYEERIAWGEARVLWDINPLHAISREIVSERIDLLIKPAGTPSLRDHLLAPLDWRLIRDAACPVLISNSNAWPAHGAVLAAVDAVDQDHAELNIKVLQHAQSLADTLNAQLHVCCVYSDLGQTVSGLQVATDYEGIKQDMREARTRSLQQLLQQLNLPQAVQHVVEGPPGRTIAGLAQRLEATVTVMGTASRKGLSKLILGNTAEDTLSHIHRDVLTVRL